MNATDHWPKHPDGSPMKMGEMHRKDRDRIFFRALFKVGQEFKALGAKVEYGPQLIEDLEANPDDYK